jgi:hypothetical protein
VNGRPWTLAEMQRAVTLRQRDRLSYDLIAGHLPGRSARAVAIKLSGLGRAAIDGRDWLPPGSAPPPAPSSGGARYHQTVRELAREELRREIAEARREAPRTPPFRGGWP